MALALVVLLNITIINAAPVKTSNTPTDKWDPLVGGIKYTNPDSGWCSVGFPAVWVEEFSLAKVYHYGFITASHCGDFPDEIFQPVPNDYLVSGSFRLDLSHPRLTDSAFIEIENYTVPNYPPGPIPRFLVFSAPQPEHIDDKILYYQPGITQVIDIYDYARSPDDVPSGIEQMYKTGARTNTTWGNIVSLSASPCRLYRNGVPTNIYVQHPIIITFNETPFNNGTDEGDSGGVVYFFEYDSDGQQYLFVAGIVAGKNDHYNTVCISPYWEIIQDFLDYGYTIYGFNNG